jgi:hypothetical protein
MREQCAHLLEMGQHPHIAIQVVADSRGATSAYDQRKSSYSGQANTCVEVADLPDGGRLVRDTKNRDGGTLRFTAAQMAPVHRGHQAGLTHQPGLEGPSGDLHPVAGPSSVSQPASLTFSCPTRHMIR